MDPACCCVDAQSCDRSSLDRTFVGVIRYQEPLRVAGHLSKTENQQGESPNKRVGSRDWLRMSWRSIAATGRSLSPSLSRILDLRRAGISMASPGLSGLDPFSEVVVEGPETRSANAHGLGSGSVGGREEGVSRVSAGCGTAGSAP